MPDALEVIEKVISDHSKITDHIKLTAGTMNDIDALFALETTKRKVAWSSTSVTELIKKRDQLLQTIDLLGDGLKNHFGYEEKALALVLGELLMKPILHQHHGILEQIENAKATLINLERLDQSELSSKRTAVLESVNNLCQAVEDHAHHEEAVLNMMKKFLEEHEA
jgi:hypothetical protein